MPTVHIDTDIGGDIDDFCALAMMLKWADTQVVAVTSVSDDQGKRAGCARYILDLAGKHEIPIASGADISNGYYRQRPGLPLETDYWPEPIPAHNSSLEDALQLLEKSIQLGATIITIGPLTNLALLERGKPGILSQADLYIMGGMIFPARKGFPEVEFTMDWNLQVDVNSSLFVLQHSTPTLIPLTMTIETYLRSAHIPLLRESDPISRLIAHQAEVFLRDENYSERYGQACKGLPDDFINFLHDPLACAIALGWEEGVEIQSIPLIYGIKDDGYLHQDVSEKGCLTRVVTKIDGAAFSEHWVDVITV